MQYIRFSLFYSLFAIYKYPKFEVHFPLINLGIVYSCFLCLLQWASIWQKLMELIGRSIFSCGFLQSSESALWHPYRILHGGELPYNDCWRQVSLLPLKPRSKFPLENSGWSRIQSNIFKIHLSKSMFCFLEWTVNSCWTK